MFYIYLLFYRRSALKNFPNQLLYKYFIPIVDNILRQSNYFTRKILLQYHILFLFTHLNIYPTLLSFCYPMHMRKNVLYRFWLRHMYTTKFSCIAYQVLPMCRCVVVHEIIFTSKYISFLFCKCKYECKLLFNH